MDKNGFLIDLSESEQTDFGRVDFSAQTDVQKTFSAIWELESQVNSGGFDSYLRNSDSDVIAYAVTALRKIGATNCASIVDAAIQPISPVPADADARGEALDAALDDNEELFDELDSKFFEYPDNLTDLLFAFVAKHPEEFGKTPS